MATIQSVNATIDNFLGINEKNLGPYDYKLGECGVLSNYRINESGGLQKREGINRIAPQFGSGFALLAFTEGSLMNQISYTADSKYIFFMTKNKLYAYGHESGTVHDIANVSAFSKSRYVMFIWNKYLYFMDDNSYRKFDGITVSGIEGYCPTLYVNTAPNGVGTRLEDVNMLCQYRQMEFISDDQSITYKLCEKNINQLISLTIDDAVISSSNYTLDLQNGVIVFNYPLLPGQLVKVKWKKSNAAEIAALLENRFHMFYGGKNDAVLFLWGCTDKQRWARRRFSGVGDPEYFPVNSYNDIGYSKYPITDIVRQYDRQIIFTQGDIYYSYIEQDETDVTFPVFSLNSEVGNEIYDGVQIVNNNPVFLNRYGLYELVSSGVRDERNVVKISDKVERTLAQLELPECVVVNDRSKNELLICYNGTALVYNYVNKCWYKFTNVNADGFFILNNELCFYTSDAYFFKFKKGQLFDHNVTQQELPIVAECEVNIGDFNKPLTYKYTSNLVMKFTDKQNLQVKVYCAVDNGDYRHIGTVEGYADIGIKPKKLRLDVRKFVNMKLRFVSDSKSKSGDVKSVGVPVNMVGKV